MLEELELQGEVAGDAEGPLAELEDGGPTDPAADPLVSGVYVGS